MARELRFIVTQKCQQNCIYCHKEGMSGREKEKLLPKDYKFLYEIARSSLGIERVTVTGGETFMRSDLKEILKELKVTGAKIKLLTNGILLEKNLEILSLIEEISISIASMDPGKHKKIHRSNEFYKIIRGIKKAVKLRTNAKIRLNICCVKDMNDNKKEIEKFIKFAKENKLSLKFIELLKPAKKNYVSIEKINEILKELKLSLLGKYKERWFYKLNGNLIELQRCPCTNVRKTGDLDFYCKSENDIFISPDGKIKPCMLKKSGNIDILGAVKQRSREILSLYYKQAIEQFGLACPIIK